MAQQKIMRSRLKKVLSSSTSSLVHIPVAPVSQSRRIEITLNPYFQFQWSRQHQQQQYQHLFLNQNTSNGNSNRGVYLYHKDYLYTRSLTDLRMNNGRVIIKSQTLSLPIAPACTTVSC